MLEVGDDIEGLIPLLRDNAERVCPDGVVELKLIGFIIGLGFVVGEVLICFLVWAQMCSLVSGFNDVEEARGSGESGARSGAPRVSSAI